AYEADRTPQPMGPEREPRERAHVGPELAGGRDDGLEGRVRVVEQRRLPRAPIEMLDQQQERGLGPAAVATIGEVVDGPRQRGDRQRVARGGPVRSRRR